MANKLRLSELRACRGTCGAAGRTFDARALLALRAAAVFAPVVTAGTLRRLADAARGGAPHAALAEWLAAIVLRDAPPPLGGALRGVRPLLLGADDGTRWLSAADDPEYPAALAALPDAVPAPTTALVDAALRSVLGAPLPAAFSALTAREIVLGRAAAGSAPPVRGILSGDAPFALAFRHDDLDLYIRERYALAIRAAMSSV